MKYIVTLLMLIGINLPIFASIVTYKGDYLGVERSKMYTLSLIKADGSEEVCDIFRSECPEYSKGGSGDKVALTKWAGHAVNWSRISADEAVRFKFTTTKSLTKEGVRILPSRKGVAVEIKDEHTMEFTIKQAGQYSIEIGDIVQWKECMLLFVDPIEKDRPDSTSKKCLVVKPGVKVDWKKLPRKIHTIYFADGVHDLGLFKLPTKVKEVYISGGAWVYGSIKVTGDEHIGTHIYGRGVLSGAKQPFRAAHQIEVSGGADNARIEGIIITDFSYFGVRTMGRGHLTNWVKMVSGWIYNCDGICMWDNSTIRNSFIWANDDNIKLYGDNILVEDCFCWQLNNGAIFQLGWGGMKSERVIVRRVDIAKTHYSGGGLNHGIINRRHGGGWSRKYLFEDIVMESPTNSIINLRPQPKGHKDTTCDISDIIIRNWSVRASDKCKNYLIGMSRHTPIKRLIIENLVVNGVKINEQNCEKVGNFERKNCATIIWR